MLLEAFSSPGDTIFVENPTYFYALDIVNVLSISPPPQTIQYSSALQDKKLKMIGINMDNEGLIIDDLEDNLKRYYQTNTRVNLCSLFLQ